MNMPMVKQMEIMLWQYTNSEALFQTLHLSTESVVDYDEDFDPKVICLFTDS